MDALIKDLIRETTATTGEALTLTLIQDIRYGRFADAASVGQSVYYVVRNGDNTELGIGTVQAGNTFDRTTPLVTVVGGVYDDTTPVKITLSGTSAVALAPTASALNDIISDITGLSAVYEPIDATILKDADIGVNVASFSHAHTGVYEPADATILKNANIGSTVQAYDATYVVDADIGVTVQAYDATYLKDADIGVSVEAYNADILTRTSSTGSASLPSGTTAQRDGAPSTGYLRYNTTIPSWEGYDGSVWGALGGGGGATGGGSDEIFVENVQVVTTDYTIPVGRNAMSTGDITINTGVTVTVSTGSHWVVI